MKLKDIVHFSNLDDLPAIILEKDVKNICIDANKVQKGDVFLQLKDDEGAQFNMRKALERGAEFVLAANDYAIKNCYAIRNPRRAFAVMEKKLHGSACDKMKIIGVTGTNGKTTTTNLISDILRGARKKVGLIGTLGAKVDGDFIDTGFTTPDPDVLHEIFQKMQNQGVEYVVMEASAHALALEKLEGIKFDVAVLTNITQDHLDFFGSMQNYEKAKFKLFSLLRSRLGVVCADGVDMDKFCKFCQVPFISYGISSPSDVFAIDIKQSLDGSRFICNCNDDVMIASCPLPGEFNVQNALAAIATCSALGIDKQTILRELKYAPMVEGRFNVISQNHKRVVIDFAHTPDGLEKIIKNVRTLTKARLITVFGCGGNRDKTKRPIMGKIASSLSDIVVLTSDNPRFEEPMDIIDDIIQGVDGQNFFVQPDRAKAIAFALDLAAQDDVVIIAGKGAEKYQDVKGEKRAYDDYSQVYDYFRNHLTVVEGVKTSEFKR